MKTFHQFLFETLAPDEVDLAGGVGDDTQGPPTAPVGGGTEYSMADAQKVIDSLRVSPELKQEMWGMARSDNNVRYALIQHGQGGGSVMDLLKKMKGYYKQYYGGGSKVYHEPDEVPKPKYNMLPPTRWARGD
jgi:hypothetical protein